MKILLGKIKPSPYQVRSKMNGQSLEELTASIAEIGLAVPIKVRPKGKGYELVYGHRRLTAVTDLGWKEIDAIVDDLTDEQVLKHGLAENIARNDLEPVDEGKAYQRLIDEFEWSQRKIARELGVSKDRVDKMISLLLLPKETQTLVASGDEVRSGGMPKGKVSPQHVKVSSSAGGLKRHVIEKAAEEGLNVSQTRKVAQSVKEANTDKLKKHLIETEFDSFTHDPERIKDVVEKRGGIDPTIKKPHVPKIWEKAVANFLRYMKQMRWWVEDFEKAVDSDQLSPEAKPFVATRLKTLRNDINRVLDKLEE